jgi:hypothetical protein
MKVAEQMALDNIGLIIQGGHKRLERLIRTVASRGREEAAGTGKCPCGNCLRRRERILDNKWEEEQV